MKIDIFYEDTIRKVHKDNKENKILIIADFRNVGYCKESETIQSKLSEELNIDLYPVCINPTPYIAKFLVRNYGSYDYWFVNKSLFEYFS